MAFSTFVLPLPFCPMKPRRMPTLSSRVASSSRQLPATVTLNFSILTSRDVGCEASTPVTARCLKGAGCRGVGCKV